MYILALKMALTKLVRKTFMVCRKATKVFFRVGLVAYGI